MSTITVQNEFVRIDRRPQRLDGRTHIFGSASWTELASNRRVEQFNVSGEVGYTATGCDVSRAKGGSDDELLTQWHA